MTTAAEFIRFSFDLKLTSCVKEKTKSFLQETSLLTDTDQQGNKIEIQKWFACAVYVAVQDTYRPYDMVKSDTNIVQPEVTVTQLIEKAGINIMDFFSTMCVLKTNYPLSDNSKQSLIALERKYLIVSALYDKFESIIGEIFCEDSAHTKLSHIPNLTNLLFHHKAMCWMLFIVAKAKVLWHRQELLATFHLMLCCIGEVVRASPTFLLQPPFDNVVTKSENPSSVLEALSDHVKTRFDEVKTVYNCWLHVASELMPSSSLPKLQELQDIYFKLYTQSGDINESLFLNHDWHLLPSASEQRRKIATRVRRTLDTAAALQTILNTTPSDLPDSLKTCLQKCTIDAEAFIKEFISQFKETFVARVVEAHEGGDRTIAERRFELATRYYYLMLDAMLKKEFERLSAAEFTSFLQNTVFHKSLLACCLEVTLMSCGSVGPVNFTPVQPEGNALAQGICFPWILKVFKLEPFDFFKIVESFIRSAPTITSQIIQHLKSAEDKLLESLAWQSDSSLFRYMSGKNSKTKCDSTAPSESFRSPNNKNAPTSPRTHLAVNAFLNKVSRLAYQRLGKLCALLNIKKEIENDIWICIEHVIYKKPDLLKDRHLDQIIMCCIFAICKLLEQDVKFKSIIVQYSSLPHARESVYKQVLTDGKKEYIIVFYNNTFTSEMKEYILSQFGNKNKVSSSSLNITQSPFILSPSFSVPGKKNIFVSPLQQSPYKNPNEIIYQKSTYSIGFQSPRKLQDINEALKSIQPIQKSGEESRGRKHLHFDIESQSNESCMSARKILKFQSPVGETSDDKEES